MIPQPCQKTCLLCLPRVADLWLRNVEHHGEALKMTAVFFFERKALYSIVELVFVVYGARGRRFKSA
jgi:hypothetical protein